MPVFCLLCALLTIPLAQANSPGGDFSLTDDNGQTFQLEQLRGHIVLLFFGYTSCPDVCPRELGVMARVLRRFNHQGKPVQGVFVSIDPARDSVEKLHQYVSFFGDNLTGLTGAPQQISKVAAQYGVRYRVSTDKAGKISVEHSSQLFIIDRNGKLQAIVPFGLDAGHVANVIDGLLQSR